MRKVVGLLLGLVLLALLVAPIATAKPLKVTIKFYEAHYTYSTYTTLWKDWEPLWAFEQTAKEHGYNVEVITLWGIYKLYVIYKPMKMNYTIYVYKWPWHWASKQKPVSVIKGVGTEVTLVLNDGMDYAIVIVDNSITWIRWEEFPACGDKVPNPAPMHVKAVVYVIDGKPYYGTTTDSGVVFNIARRFIINPYTGVSTDDWCYLVKMGDLYLSDV